jgi:hypothetical protein
MFGQTPNSRLPDSANRASGQRSRRLDTLPKNATICTKVAFSASAEKSGGAS